MATFGSWGRTAVILLVEDTLDDVKLTKIAFEKIKIAHEIEVVGDGDQALAFLRQSPPYENAPRPDLILLDLNMPGADGRDVLRDVKKDPKLRTIPVIILTTSDSEVDLMLTYNLHANAYLTKPLDLDEWEDLVEGFAHFWLKLAKYPTSVFG